MATNIGVNSSSDTESNNGSNPSSDMESNNGNIGVNSISDMASNSDTESNKVPHAAHTLVLTVTAFLSARRACDFLPCPPLFLLPNACNHLECTTCLRLSTLPPLFLLPNACNHLVDLVVPCWVASQSQLVPTYVSVWHKRRNCLLPIYQSARAAVHWVCIRWRGWVVKATNVHPSQYLLSCNGG
jgi:hypothetical protein